MLVAKKVQERLDQGSYFAVPLKTSYKEGGSATLPGRNEKGGKYLH
jgi:hypothetical protein